MWSFIGFVSLPLLLHADFVNVSALNTGLAFVTFWEYCPAFRLGAISLRWWGEVIFRER